MRRILGRDSSRHWASKRGIYTGVDLNAARTMTVLSRQMRDELTPAILSNSAFLQELLDKGDSSRFLKLSSYVVIE